MSVSPRMTIGEAARRTGVSIKALRFYDDLGILDVAGRSEANYRLFTEDVISCVELIRRLQQAGLSLRQLQAIVRGQERGEDPVALLRRAYAEALARTERELATLQARREALREVVAAAPGDLTLQGTGGCSVCGKTVPHSTAQSRRDSWPATPQPPNRRAPNSLAERFRTPARRESRPSLPPSRGSSFARSR